MVCYSSCTDSLFYEQSTNLVKSVRRPIGHTTTTTTTATTGELQANAPLGTTTGEHQASYPITAWAKNNKLYFGREQFFQEDMLILECLMYFHQTLWLGVYSSAQLAEEGLSTLDTCLRGRTVLNNQHAQHAQEGTSYFRLTTNIRNRCGSMICQRMGNTKGSCVNNENPEYLIKVKM